MVRDGARDQRDRAAKVDPVVVLGDPREVAEPGEQVKPDGEGDHGRR